MKAQYAGRCTICSIAIPAGTDVYYDKTAGIAHWDCHDNPRPTPELIALASGLGFIEHRIAMNTNWMIETERIATEHRRNQSSCKKP